MGLTADMEHLVQHCAHSRNSITESHHPLGSDNPTWPSQAWGSPPGQWRVEFPVLMVPKLLGGPGLLYCG